MRATLLLGVICCLAPAITFGAKPAPSSVSVLSVEAETGLVLYEQNADVQRPPASMVKLMLMLMVAEGIDRGDWSLETPITATRHAQRMGGTQVYLEAGETHPLGRLMQAVAVSSANDAAMAVAEGLWNGEQNYLASMNARAQKLGMKRSEFHSVHGLPPDRGERPDRTTARDMATLARECVKHERILAWTDAVRYEFRPGEGAKYTTNKLLKRMPECDGLKTGFIRKSGFCIAATARRDGVRIVSVVMGHTDKEARFNLAEELLLNGLDNVRRERIVIEGVTPTPNVQVSNSKTSEVSLVIDTDIWITARSEDWDRLEVVMDHPEELQAPAKAMTAIGEVRVELDGAVLARAPLRLSVDVQEAGWLWKLERSIGSLFAARD